MTLMESKHQAAQQVDVETRERLESTESIPPLVMVNPNGKAPKTPSSNLKKRKLTKASEEEPKSFWL